jgi:hypothetical protein
MEDIEGGEGGNGVWSQIECNVLGAVEGSEATLAVACVLIHRAHLRGMVVVPVVGVEAESLTYAGCRHRGRAVSNYVWDTTTRSIPHYRNARSYVTRPVPLCRVLMGESIASRQVPGPDRLRPGETDSIEPRERAGPSPSCWNTVEVRTHQVGLHCGNQEVGLGPLTQTRGTVGDRGNHDV